MLGRGRRWPARLGNNAGTLASAAVRRRAAGRGDGRRGGRRLLVRAARERPGVFCWAPARAASSARARSWITRRPPRRRVPGEGDGAGGRRRSTPARCSRTAGSPAGAPNDSGQLGLGDQEDRTRPTTVDTNGGRARAVAAGPARRPACSRRRRGDVLGRERPRTARPRRRDAARGGRRPRRSRSGPASRVALAVGGAFACALLGYGRREMLGRQPCHAARRADPGPGVR